MSESEYKQLVERVIQNVASPTISTDTGLEAAQVVKRLAEQEEIEWAIAGGIAMYLYGSPRLTRDLDIIASKNLSLTPQHRLSFGGASYTLTVGKYEVQLDWIVRNDGFQKYYHAALKDAISLPNGIRVVTPDWLVILKYKAGRQRDLDDIVFLLKQPKLVNRPTVKQKVLEIGGEDAWLMMMAGFRRLCDLADSKTREPGKYYDEE
jgi:hypothetical protein